jgi:hypothetical protein
MELRAVIQYWGVWHPVETAILENELSHGTIASAKPANKALSPYLENIVQWINSSQRSTL